MDKLFIVIPAYNEEENIRQVVEDWCPVVEKHNGEGESRLVIIDDGSKDHTFEILKSCAEDKPLLLPLTKPNGGHGATVLYGYHYALDHDADYIFQTDSDGQTLPEEFEPFWAERENYDMVIGWRRGRQRPSGRRFPCVRYQDAEGGHQGLLRCERDGCKHAVSTDEGGDHAPLHRSDSKGLQSVQRAADGGLYQEGLCSQVHPHHVPAAAGRGELD